MPRIMIMAGGTGGHVFPALAVAEELRSRGVEVVWLGTPDGLEAELVPRAGFAIEWISIGGLRGKGVASWLLAPLRLLRALWQAWRVLQRRRPGAVLGMGGFASGPGGLVTWLQRRPLLIHEQNAIAGLTNRVLSRLATVRLQAFPGALPEHLRPVVCGNPVRPEIAALPGPQQRLAARQGPLRLLVLGGSLGARALNLLVPQAVGCLPRGVMLDIRHQTGKRHLDETRTAYTQAAVTAEIMPFIDDMAEAYGWADLVVCRAGALTIEELAASGSAAILVPFPHAVDDHQTRNGSYLSQAGAAVLIQQQALTAQRLADEIACLGQSPALSAAAGDGMALCDRIRVRCLQMALQARRLAHPDATARVADFCMEAVHHG